MGKIAATGVPARVHGSTKGVQEGGVQGGTWKTGGFASNQVAARVGTKWVAARVGAKWARNEQ